jgi:hypothetical protein
MNEPVAGRTGHTGRVRIGGAACDGIRCTESGSTTLGVPRPAPVPR